MADVGIVGRDAVGMFKKKPGKDTPVRLTTQPERYAFALEVCDRLHTAVKRRKELALAPPRFAVKSFHGILTGSGRNSFISGKPPA